MYNCNSWILIGFCSLLLAAADPASAAVDNVVTQWLALLQDASRAQAIPAHLVSRCAADSVRGGADVLSMKWCAAYMFGGGPKA